MSLSAAFDSAQLRSELCGCPPGLPGWSTFERTAAATLTHLFVPPLRQPRIQARTYSGVERRDAVFPNHNHDPATHWGFLHRELDARMIAVEFKNYDRDGIGREEVDQAAGYLRTAWGRLAILCSNIEPTEAAYRRRNTIFSDQSKVVLFLTTAHLEEMLDMKDRGEDPADFIVDSLDDFYLQHE